MYLTLFAGTLWWSLFCYALICVLFRFGIILTMKRELVALLYAVGKHAVCNCGIPDTHLLYLGGHHDKSF